MRAFLLVLFLTGCQCTPTTPAAEAALETGVGFVGPGAGKVGPARQIAPTFIGLP